MMCAIALERACELAASGLVPDSHRKRWGQERKRIESSSRARGYSERKRAYVRGQGETIWTRRCFSRSSRATTIRTQHASSLLSRDPGRARARGSAPSLLQRGRPTGRGFFIACSFWLAEAYARQGRLDEADALMVELVPLANDVGLFAEEIDLATGEFLGNFPQALSHLALVNAAVSIEKAQA